MAEKRKRVTFLVTVSAPKGIPVSAIRREIKCRVGELCEWDDDTGLHNVKLIGAPKSVTRRNLFELAHRLPMVLT